jgi:hypothetical protein
MDKLGYISLNSKYLLGETSIKNSFFLFDKVYFDKQEYEQSKEFLLIGKHMAPRVKKEYGDDIVDVIKSNISDVEFLQDKGLLREVNPVQIEQKFISENPKSNYTKFFNQFAAQSHSYYFQSGSIISSIVALSVFLQKENYNPSFENDRAIILSDIIGILEKTKITPIFNPGDLPLNGKTPLSKEQTITNIVISKFPITDFDKISWERILDFKYDPGTVTNQLRLRNWMTEISKSNLSSQEIEEKLDYLINEYKAHLKRHQFEFQYSILTQALITTTEIAQHLIRLKFSDALKTILDIGSRKLKLIDIIENAPGKEIALFQTLKKISK